MMVHQMLLAHGGTAGLIAEVGFLAVPVAVFTVMAVVARRRERAGEAVEPEEERT